MATSLDLQEQEQIDALKAFWNRYGNLITWALVGALALYAGWNGWNWYQRDQAGKAGAMFDELERAVQAGDVAKAGLVFTDIRSRFPDTAYAQQGALMAARLQFEKGKPEDARATLAWASEKGSDADARTIARLRLAALQADAKQFDAAFATLAAADAKGFEPLVADRRGDILLLQGKKAEARAAYELAYAGLSPKVEYRRLVEAKLAALGAAPAAKAASAAAASAAQPARSTAPAPGASR
jgi:predicted negative regulator of RcsB-dependent stress response